MATERGDRMTHYMSSRDGSFKLKVNMGCNHPDMVGNNAETVGCNGKCEECNHSIATMTIPEVLELIKRADCNWRD